MRKIVIDTLKIINGKQNVTLYIILMVTIFVLIAEFLNSTIYSNEYILLIEAILKLTLALTSLKYAVHALYNLCLDMFQNNTAKPKF